MHYFAANLFTITCTKFNQKYGRCLEYMTKPFWLTFLGHGVDRTQWLTADRYAFAEERFCDLDLFTHDFKNRDSSSHNYSIGKVSVRFGSNLFGGSEEAIA